MDSLAALVLALAVCGCGRVPLDDPGARVPARHRTSSVCAPVDLSAPRAGDCRSSQPPPPIADACSGDADCKTGVHGRCVRPHIGTCSCVYDACGSDADCPAGKACACNSAPFGNTCVPASCRIDADCGVAGFCGPVISPCADAINEYRCYAAADQCLADSDCPAGEPCLAFSGAPWMCQPPTICR